MSSGELCNKFRLGVQGGIHGATEPLFGAAERWGQLGQSDLPYHHQVDITCRQCFGPRHRAIDKRPSDAGRKRCEGLPKHLHEAYGLGQQALQLAKKRTVGIGLKIHPVSLPAAAQDARFGEALQFPLEA